MRWCWIDVSRSLGRKRVRVGFDTQQDTYEDALAVLRRAYGRRGPVRKQVDATPEGNDGDEVAGSATDSAATAKKASASKSTTSRFPATKNTATKKTATKKTATRKVPSVAVAKRPGRATRRQVGATG